jgi:hypothetical protein
LANTPPFFHVVVWLKPAPTVARLVFCDLSESELKSRFLKPYRRGTQIVVSGEVIDLKEISSVTISKTQKAKDQEMDALRQASRASVEKLNRESNWVVFIGSPAHYDEEIASVGENVTDRFVPSAPGSSTFLTSLQPWFVGIGTTMILAYAFGIGLS